MSFYKTEKFKKLQKQWNKKLEKSGFEDAESETNGKVLLKVWHSSYFHLRHSPSSFEFKREYYRVAALFLQSHVFESEREKRAWELHCEGKSLREIGKIMRVHYLQIHFIIRELAKVMKGGFNVR